MQAEIEGFLGLGASSVRITSDQFEQKGDRIACHHRRSANGRATPAT